MRLLNLKKYVVTLTIGHSADIFKQSLIAF